MAADAFHREIEDGMRKAKNLYDFDDFDRIVNSKGVSAPMEIGDFKQYASKLSHGKKTNYPKLGEIVICEVCSRKDRTLLAGGYCQATHFTEDNFSKTTLRGISKRLNLKHQRGFLARRVKRFWTN